MEKRGIRKIFKSSESYAVTLPIEKVRELGWKEGRKVEIKKIRGGFVVRDAR